MGPTLQRDGTWVYPCIGAALSMMGLDDIGVYIARHQNTVAQYIATRPIMDLYLVENRNPGMRLSRRWWEQPAMDIRVIIVGHVAAEGGVESLTQIRGSWRIRHPPYWVTCYIMYYLSDIRLIIYVSHINFSLPTSILPYPNIHLLIPPIHLYPSLPSPPPLLHAPLLSPGYP